MAIQTEEEGGNIQLALPPFFTTCNPVAGSHEALDGKRKSSLRLGQPFIGGAGFPSLTVGGDPLRLFVSSPPVSVNGTSNLGRGQAKARPCGSLPTVVYLRRKPKAKKANGARSFGWLVLTSFLVGNLVISHSHCNNCILTFTFEDSTNMPSCLEAGNFSLAYLPG